MAWLSGDLLRFNRNAGNNGNRDGSARKESQNKKVYRKEWVM